MVLLALLLALFSLSHALEPASPMVPTKSLPPQMAPSMLTGLRITTILSDIDGTLLSSGHTLSPATVDVLTRLVRGTPPSSSSSSSSSLYRFFPCTGRSRTSMNNAEPRIAALFGGLEKTPGVYQQGLMVYGSDGKLIYEKLLPTSVVTATERFCQQRGVAVVAYCGERVFCRAMCPQVEQLRQWSDPTPEVHASGLDRLVDIGVRVHKLILLDDEENIVALRPHLAAALGDSAALTRAVPGMLEVLPPGASKGEGVQVLLDHLHTSPDNVVAFGDGENDLEMLSLVRLGIAVGNAKPVLKGVADALTASNDEDGVAHVLNMLLEHSANHQDGNDIIM